jgi:hypothetical protein
MSTSNEDLKQKGFICDRIEAASDIDETPGHNIIEAERKLSVFANVKKHWRVLLTGKRLGTISMPYTNATTPTSSTGISTDLTHPKCSPFPPAGGKFPRAGYLDQKR